MNHSCDSKLVSFTRKNINEITGKIQMESDDLMALRANVTVLICSDLKGYIVVIQENACI